MDLRPPPRPRVGFHTFGCKLNQYETESIAFALQGGGFDVVGSDQPAQAYVINTCTITSRADHKARSLIRALARDHPTALLIVTGCSAELERETFQNLSPNVIVVPQSRKDTLLRLPGVLAAQSDPAAQRRALRQAEGPQSGDPFAFAMERGSFRTRAFLKVQDGCDCHCAYCRVPMARGPGVSLAHDEVVRRACRMEERGVGEIVLTGVNLSAWSSGWMRLDGLLRLLLASTSGTRFRISSLEPESLDDALLEALHHPRVCPHFHIPVQSGSDAVLARMRRRYRSARVLEGVSRLRAPGQDPFIAADIIVGFPGETWAEFDETLGLVRSATFAALHVFPFSPRPGTAAFEMRPRVPERVRSERGELLRGVSRGLTAAYAARWVGREVDVLFEKPGQRGMLGTSANYLRVETTGIPASASAVGRRATVLVSSAGAVCDGRFIGFIP